MGERSREENIRYFEELKACCEMFLKSLESVPGKIGAYSAFLSTKSLSWKPHIPVGRKQGIGHFVSTHFHLLTQLLFCGTKDQTQGLKKGAG